MTDESSSSGNVSCVLRGFWLAIHRVTLVALPAVIVVALVVTGVQFAGGSPPPWWFPVLLVLVCAFLMWVQVRTATRVSLEGEELVFVRSWLGEVRIPAASVRSIGRPVLGGQRSGVRVRADGLTVPLAVGMPGVPALVDAVAVHRPDLSVGTL